MDKGVAVNKEPYWIGRYLSESTGVFLIVLFGNATIFIGILFGASPDLLTVGLGWGLAVALAVWVAGSTSGAHFNPGVTLVMALRRKFPWKHVAPYVVFQIFGGFVAAWTLQGLFHKIITARLASLDLEKGDPGSQLVSMLFVPNVPNPALVGIGPADAAASQNVANGWDLVSVWQGAAGEFLATGLLVIFILVLIDKRNANKPTAGLFPLVLALGVMMLVVVEGPISMVSLNAARDLGPRIFLAMTGWGDMAFPGPRGSWWATSIAPTLGAITGGYFYDLVVARFMLPPSVEASAEPETREAESLPETATVA